MACRDHALDQSVNGGWGHIGSDGSTPQARMDRYGKWRGMSGENINYSAGNANDIITSLYIDQMTASRAHRLIMMKDSFTKVGIYVAGPEGVK